MKSLKASKRNSHGEEAPDVSAVFQNVLSAAEPAQCSRNTERRCTLLMCFIFLVPGNANETEPELRAL